MLATTLLFGGAALAVDEPDELMTGKITVIKTAKLAKFEAKPTSGTPLPSGANAPTAVGAQLRIFDTGQVGNGDVYTLAESGWSRIPKNESKDLKGYKFKGAPCKSVIIKANVVKANCKGSAVQLDTPFAQEVGIVLALGQNAKRYCATFGGSGVNNDKKVKREGASLAAACPTPLLPTTTTLRTTTSTFLVVTTSTSSTSSTSTPEESTTTTSAPEGSTTSTSAPEGSTTSTSTVPEGSTTSTSAPEGSTTSTSAPEGSTTSTSSPEGSTTSTSTPEGSTTSTSAPEGSTTTTSTPESSTTTTSIGGGGCCNGQTFVSFATVSTPGDCGDIIDVNGMVVSNVNCGGLYTGGGGNSVPLPFAVPDLGLAISAITECTGQTAILGSTNSDETGSNRNCTNTGCLFGAPLAVPNAMTIPTSVCVTNTASQPLTGTAVCDTGATDVVLPLSSQIFLTGDKLPATGIQPCPLCTGGDPNTPNSGTCQGGPNNAMSCTPGTTAINDSYPTSHDCPPDPSDSIGSLPVAFKLTSGTLSWNATRPTNDTESTASKQTRVFSGFCRDVALPGGTGSFDVSADPGGQFKQCWENAMAVGTPCSEADNGAESCEQRNQGFFGPEGGAQKTILTIGSATSILSGPAFGALVSIFSIPPTFDATIDGAGDLPGPGAVAIPGTASLCSSANPCPAP